MHNVGLLLKPRYQMECLGCTHAQHGSSEDDRAGALWGRKVMSAAQPALSCAYHMYKAGAAPRAGSVKTVGWIAKHGILWGQDMRSTGSLGARISVNKGPVCVQVGKDAVVIEADAIKNRDVMFKHLSSNDFTKNDPMLSSYVHEYSTKAAEMLLAAAGTLLFCLNFSFNALSGNETPTWIFCSNLSLCTSDNLPLWNKCVSCTWLGGPPGSLLVMCIALKGYPEPTPL